MPKNFTPPRHRDDVVDYADVAFQMTAAQISSNYLKYIKARIIPELGVFSNAPLRELRTLMVIAHFAEPVRGAKITRLLSYDPATVSRSTKWLIEKGLVVVEDNSKDGRAVFYGLTPKGLELSDLYRQLTKQSIEELNDVDPDRPTRKEIMQAMSVLEKIRDRSHYAAQLGAEYKRAKKRAAKSTQT